MIARLAVVVLLVLLVWVLARGIAAYVDAHAYAIAVFVVGALM